MKIIQQTNMNDKQSMGYEIIAESGELLVVDGGYSGNGDELRRLIKSAGGHVSLWLITHPHCDHHNAVIEVLSDPQGIVTDRIGTSMIPDTWAKGKRDEEDLLTWNQFERTLDNVFQEDFSLLILGDLAVEGGRRLLMKGYDLRADAVQMAHHGQSGVEKNVYQAISPKWAFWPTPDWLWQNVPYIGGPPGAGPFKTQEVAGWLKELGAENITSFEHTVMFDSKTKRTVEI